ncbi:putative membrane protein affecting hemolysin expression [Bartonella silvatica]|uniref:Membrane protein affecting hemolysin expression n=1 Tax=Bartonella silvatica TaxID=357760 RepID=A0ABV2HH91_9HYPH
MIWIKRNLILIGAALAAFFMALAKAFTLGKQVAQKKQTEEALKAAITRLEVENEINQKSDADVRAALSDWLRK